MKKRRVQVQVNIVRGELSRRRREGEEEPLRKNKNVCALEQKDFCAVGSDAEIVGMEFAPGMDRSGRGERAIEGAEIGLNRSWGVDESDIGRAFRQSCVSFMERRAPQTHHRRRAWLDHCVDAAILNVVRRDDQQSEQVRGC